MLDALKQPDTSPAPADDVAATATEPSPLSDEPLRLNLSGLWDRDWQKVLVIMLTLLVGLALICVAWQAISPILHTIILFILGGLLAFALSSPVDALNRKVGNRAAAVAAVYVLVGALVVGGIVLLADPFVHQVAGLAGALP